ncbi:MAG: DUF72 domain-containing protein [Syntrophobacteraceae bacterium]
MSEEGAIRIRTSGWSYAHWKGPFYPEKTRDSKLFEFYIRKFDTVQINNSFYHLPLRKTFEKWRASSPDSFVFAVKASRFITHTKRLKDCGPAVENFRERTLGLGEKIGPVLFQRPPALKIDPKRLNLFLQELPGALRYSFEFRNSSWFHPETYSLLSEFNAAFCLYELNGKTSPLETTADFIYIRLHGPGGKYQGRYSSEQLRSWSETFKHWTKESKDVFCYFDNDEKGFAAVNAMGLSPVHRAPRKPMSLERALQRFSRLKVIE